MSFCLRKCIVRNKAVIIPSRTNTKRKHIHKYIIKISKLYEISIIHRSVWYGTNFIKGRNHNSVEIVPKEVLINEINKLTGIINPMIAVQADGISDILGRYSDYAHRFNSCIKYMNTYVDK